jgi:hypothetical protein
MIVQSANNMINADLSNAAYLSFGEASYAIEGTSKLSQKDYPKLSKRQV